MKKNLIETIVSVWWRVGIALIAGSIAWYNGKAAVNEVKSITSKNEENV